MSPNNHGCNPPHDHGNIWNNTNAWKGKIPLLDFSIAVKGVDFNTKGKGGVGLTAYTEISKDIIAKLSKAFPVKAEWVTGKPASDEHAAACAWRLYTASIAYINALNDIPNNGAPLPTAKPSGGDGDDEVDGLTADTAPEAVDATDILKSFMVTDYVAAPEEPVPNPTD